MEHIAVTETLMQDTSNAKEQQLLLARLMAMLEKKPAITASSEHAYHRNPAATVLRMVWKRAILEQITGRHVLLITAQAAHIVLAVAV
jgi:hypothetical protein